MKLITLFMWPYQPHFRSSLEHAAESLLAALGVNLKPRALLVGIRRPGTEGPNPVCIEPEDGRWTLNRFDGIIESIESTYKNHELHRMFYSNDPDGMRDKPENARKDSVRKEIISHLKSYDEENSVISFVGFPVAVSDYYVAPIIQIPVEIFSLFPVTKTFVVFDRYESSPSLVHSAIVRLLSDATQALRLPDPGRNLFLAKTKEIINAAATDFMHAPAMAIDHVTYMSIDLFQSMNELSSLLYEGTKGVGSILLGKNDDPSIAYSIKLATPVPFREARWARKVLQISSPDLLIISDGKSIYGLGNFSSSVDREKSDVFSVDFIDHHHWRLRKHEQVLLVSIYGEARLPDEPLNRPRLEDNFLRLFPSSSQDDADRSWALLQDMATQGHGSMVVVASDAAEEALRLSNQGMMVEPFILTPQLFERLCKIDGSILIDPAGRCYGVGLVLDGIANDLCKPSRGSRYNSAVRYVYSSKARRMAIVRSDDGTTDVIPLLRPKVSREEIEKFLVEFENAGPDEYHASRLYLDRHRFYLNPEQCRRANVAIDRLDKAPREVGVIYVMTRKFEQNSEMNDEYYK